MPPQHISERQIARAFAAIVCVITLLFATAHAIERRSIGGLAPIILWFAFVLLLYAGDRRK